MLMLFVLSCKTWNIVKPGAWLPDPLQGLNSLKIPHILPVVLEVFLLEVSRLKLTVRAVSMQVRSKVRGLLCFVSEACSAVLSHLVVPTRCNPMAVARQSPCPWGILQARILEWVAMLSSRGSSQPWDGTQGSCIAAGCLSGQCLCAVLAPYSYLNKPNNKEPAVRPQV